jgi:hypothetical protein
VGERWRRRLPARDEDCWGFSGERVQRSAAREQLENFIEGRLGFWSERYLGFVIFSSFKWIGLVLTCIVVHSFKFLLGPYIFYSLLRFSGYETAWPKCLTHGPPQKRWISYLLFYHCDLNNIIIIVNIRLLLSYHNILIFFIILILYLIIKQLIVVLTIIIVINLNV